jgi:hypothetical protein
VVGVKGPDFFTALVHGLKDLSETSAILGTKFRVFLFIYCSLQACSNSSKAKMISNLYSVILKNKLYEKQNNTLPFCD